MLNIRVLVWYLFLGCKLEVFMQALFPVGFIFYQFYFDLRASLETRQLVCVKNRNRQTQLVSPWFKVTVLGRVCFTRNNIAGRICGYNIILYACVNSYIYTYSKEPSPAYIAKHYYNSFVCIWFKILISFYKYVIYKPLSNLYERTA